VVLRFGGLAQPWLKEAAKRWARARLLGSLSPRSMERYLRELMEFSRWLADRDVASPRDISRELLEDYLLYVRTRPWAQSTRRRRLGALRAFLDEQRDDGLAGMPRTAVLHFAEMPRVALRPPKGLEKDVFEQLIDSQNLALLGSEQHRTLVLLLAHTGLRVSSLVLLRRDALQEGSDGHPYLRFDNVKLSREAVIPIGPALAEQLRRQEEHLSRTYPDGTDWLLPSPPGRGAPGMGKGGRLHIRPGSVNELLHSYVCKADIRDRDGRLATWIHAHAFRHHLGTSLVNDGVPLPVIQKLFDHASITMTAHYAQLHDETLRRAITRWHERVNIRGERIALPLDGPLEEAAWMKERIAREAGAAQRLLRAAAGADLPAPQRLPELRQLPHRQLLPRRPPAAARAHQGAARARRAGRPAAARRAARARRALTDPDPPRPRRDRRRPARVRCGAAAGCRRARRGTPGARLGRWRMNPKRAIALREAAAARSTGAAERARRALIELAREGGMITFALVATRARVSRQFLNSHPELRAEIERQRGQQRPPARLPMGARAGDESIRVRLRVALNENKRLRQEIAALRDELAVAHGRVREFELGTPA
jgi:site-specific recombinase XerD